MSGFCNEPECINAAERGEKCAGHRKQLQRDGATRKLEANRAQMTPLERLLKASTTREDADFDGDEAAYRRAVDNLCKAALGYAKSRGWQKPKYRKPAVRTVSRSGT